jgi:methylated-DNA-[protein]-cysteine S-methyltransferase
MYSDRFQTPIGVLGIGATDLGLARIDFPFEAHSRAVAAHSGAPAGAAEATASETTGTGTGARILEEARRQLTEYFAGDRRVFELPLDWTGVVGLRLQVLRALEATVPFGDTTTYGKLAALVRTPAASRAVGGIMGSNPLPIVVPCHRVLAADGLGGFGGGLATKEWLLAWEGVIPQPLDFPHFE